MKERNVTSLANVSSFFSRFLVYQKERFPLVQYIPLISIFTYSAASYSRMCRGDESIIDLGILVTASVTAILFFLLLRISDEFKDYEDDMKYRPYRPVPRGLVSLKELSKLGWSIIAITFLLNLYVMPSIIIPYIFVLLFMYLMYNEFFVSNWLKARPLLYATSHMLIMPVIDFYTTGVDWIQYDTFPPNGVEVFLIVSFFNGVVIEIGRKIRVPEKEEDGVETYSSLYGPNRATYFWIVAMSITMLSAVWACSFIDFTQTGSTMLIIAFSICIIPGILFLIKKKHRYSKLIEAVSGVWTILMYLIVGAAPMLLKSFGV